ncbi:MAG: AAA family ATPase [Lachnospiraceae bacterium]|nr:AAA family ATPase [Lachnospiraceae bacterium]
MTKKHIVIAMYDEKYVASLEIGFLKNAYESIRLETITEESFFEQYFKTPQIIDCLIIDEKLYTESISRQGINQVFVLVSDDSEENKYQYANVISKFSSVKEIIHKVTGKLGISMGISEKQDGEAGTTLIMVYSPVGGVGKTTAAMALCYQLGLLNKRVIYVNFDTIQNYQWIVNREEYIENGLERYMTRHDISVADKLSEEVWQCGFSCAKPFKSSKLSYGIKNSDYLFAIEELKKTNKYDYIVIDTMSDLGELNLSVLDKCDKVITVMDQSAYGVYKVMKFLECINYQDNEKFMFLCNKYYEGGYDYLQQCPVDIIEKIPYLYSQNGCLTLDEIKSNGLMKMAALILL